MLFDDPNDPNALLVWDAKASRFVTRLSGCGVYGLAHIHDRGAPASIEFSPDGALLAVLGAWGGKTILRLWDVEVGVELFNLRGLDLHKAFHWGNEGRFLGTLGPSSLGSPE